MPSFPNTGETPSPFCHRGGSRRLPLRPLVHWCCRSLKSFFLGRLLTLMGARSPASNPQKLLWLHFLGRQREHVGIEMLKQSPRVLREESVHCQEAERSAVLRCWQATGVSSCCLAPRLQAVIAWNTLSLSVLCFCCNNPPSVLVLFFPSTYLA